MLLTMILLLTADLAVLSMMMVVKMVVMVMMMMAIMMLMWITCTVLTLDDRDHDVDVAHLEQSGRWGRGNAGEDTEEDTHIEPV